MGTITLILTIIVVILTILLLSILSLVISPRNYYSAHQGKRSRRHEHVSDEEEEQLLPDTEGRDVQVPTSGDRAFALPTEINHWRHAEARETEEVEAAQEIENLRRDLSIATSQNTELRRQHEALSNDLEGARLFLNTADTFSDSEIIQILQKLNVEVQHTSTFMADHLVNVLTLDAVTSVPREQSALNSAKECIGSTLVQLLQTAKRDDLPLYLQIAIQAYLTHHLYWIVSSWTFDKECNTFIDGIYRRLRQKEQQPICGRWRSLTHGHTLPTCASDPEPFAALIIAGLSHILSAAGCTSPQTDITPELSSMFKTKVLSAVVLAGRLNEMVAGVLSGDFEAFVVQPGEPFRADIMEEDADGSRDGVRDSGKVHAILCTSELGLAKWVQVGTQEKEMRTVLKAKVVLESFADDG